MSNKIIVGNKEFSTRSIPGQFIEGMLGEKIGEVFKSIDILNEGSVENNIKAKSLDNVKATIAVARLELNELVDLLADMKDATLNTRHRVVRKSAMNTLRYIDKRADDIVIATDVDDKVIVDCTKSVLRWILKSTLAMSDHSNETALQFLKEIRDEENSNQDS